MRVCRHYECNVCTGAVTPACAGCYWQALNHYNTQGSCFNPPPAPPQEPHPPYMPPVSPTPTPPSSPPLPVHEFKGQLHSYCGQGYYASFEHRTLTDDIAFDCKRRCTMDNACLAFELKTNLCELHGGSQWRTALTRNLYTA